MTGLVNEKDVQRVKSSGLFDEKWYVQQYPDVKIVGIDPIVHYLWIGWKIGRDPGPFFSTRGYLAANPSIASSGKNPLLHAITEPADITWVVNRHDKMTRYYRAEALSKQLLKQGWQIRVVLDESLTDEFEFRSKIVVLCRIAASDRLRNKIKEYRSKGGVVVYDVDDLIFDIDRLDLLQSYRARDDAAKEVARRGFEWCRETMLCSDLITVSTAALQKEVDRLGKPSVVVPNCLSEEAFAIAASLEAREDAYRPPVVNLCFLSGTKTHQTDFDECAAALARVLTDNRQAVLHVVGHLDLPEALAGCRVMMHPLMTYPRMLRFLSTMDINLAPLEANNAFTDCKSELKVFEAALFSIPTVASPTSPYAAIIASGVNGFLAKDEMEWTDALSRLITDAEYRSRLGEEAKRSIVPVFDVKSVARTANAYLGALKRDPAGYLADAQKRLAKLPVPASDRPLVSLVTILYRKEREIRAFLESLRRQDFDGPFEVIFVDDRSPDNSVQVIEETLEHWSHCTDHNPAMEISIISNDANSGNCISRNKGVQAARGDIIAVVDCDCLLNRSLVRSHYEKYANGDCDIVIGPKGVETETRPALSALNEYEGDISRALRDARPQDAFNPDSFVNSVTRNFSISRDFLNTVDGDLFDPLFSYSADPESGFGWEDVELGCRAYLKAARIKYADDTFSLHISHETTEHASDKPVKSLKNFRRLHQKHPTLFRESRQWTLKTFDALVNWMRKIGAEVDSNPDYVWLNRHLSDILHSPRIQPARRPLRIITHRWHCPHQYELYKSGHEFTLVTGAGTGMCNRWEWGHRPMPKNARFKPVENVNFKDYDAAIIHFDENVFHPERSVNPDTGKQMVPDDWGKTFKWFLQNCKLPTFAICHGTPQFYGQYDRTYDKENLLQVIEDSRQEIVEALRNVHVVCNSHQARAEWGFHKSSVIWHGFAPSDFPPGPHDRGVLAMLDRAIQNRPHYNGFFGYRAVRDALIPARLRIDHLHVPNPPEGYVTNSHEWAVAKYQNYVREIARYSVYYNPTVRSPMPRSRGEAMMAGLVSVSKRNHDVDLFIKNGVNGFYSDDDLEIAEFLQYLDKNPAARADMGKKSRALAQDVFNQDNYLYAWQELLNAAR